MSDLQLFHFAVHIYYEDTDHSGFVYHPNYFKYFERAREHAIGKEKLIRLWHDDGIGFVVYKADITFAEGAIFGDILDIRSSSQLESAYRTNWHQEVWRPNGTKAAVTANIQLVAVNRQYQLIPIPFDKLT